jgi:alkanesulfonate monooxygenase SsuD/methylene tetrahydromethanopterin reductase-like flavin-dependent oxidoreductase (luciferase family)
MSEDEPRISTLAFLTPGNYLDDDPSGGLEDTLKLFEHGEELGFDGAWIRQRHLEHGVSSGAVFLAAASQRTRTIELGTAVIPIGYESPFRLAEDLATADVLSRGRLQAGFSAGRPQHVDLIGHLVHDRDWRDVDFSHRRLERLLDNLRGEFLGDADTVIHSPGNVQRPRLQPYSRGLVDRIWYGTGSLGSARWAGSAGVNLLLGNVTQAEGTDDFSTAQVNQIAAFRAELPPGRTPRIALGRVILPTDSADAPTRRKYEAYVASRYERTLSPRDVFGKRMMFATDLIGPAAQIVEQLRSERALHGLTELRAELPYEFVIRDYEQILHDVVRHVAPALGWTPAHTASERPPRGTNDAAATAGATA